MRHLVRLVPVVLAVVVAIAAGRVVMAGFCGAPAAQSELTRALSR